jgi:hypothetical protein
MIVGISSPARTALYHSLLAHSCTALDSLRNHHSHPSLLNTALLHPEPALSSCRTLQQAHEPICRVSRQSSHNINNDRLSEHLCKTLPRAFDNATAMLPRLHQRSVPYSTRSLSTVPDRAPGIALRSVRSLSKTRIFARSLILVNDGERIGKAAI